MHTPKRKSTPITRYQKVMFAIALFCVVATGIVAGLMLVTLADNNAASAGDIFTNSALLDADTISPTDPVQYCINQNTVWQENELSSQIESNLVNTYAMSGTTVYIYQHRDAGQTCVRWGNPTPTPSGVYDHIERLFYIIVPVEDIEDMDTLSAYMVSILNVTRPYIYNYNSLPGTLLVTFSDSQSQRTFHFSFNDAMNMGLYNVSSSELMPLLMDTIDEQGSE